MVDIQNDFALADGALSVPGGMEVVPVVNAVQPRFDRIIATQDWHPAQHGSFASNHDGRSPGDVIELGGVEQILWPAHCVQGTEGADFVEDLELGDVDRVFRKGTDPEIDSYSGFFDNGRKKQTGLDDYLRKLDGVSLWVCGLATDYCVKFTALDAAELGYETHVITDACRGVELAPGDVDAALAAMERAGVALVESTAITGVEETHG